MTPSPLLPRRRAFLVMRIPLLMPEKTLGFRQIHMHRLYRIRGRSRSLKRPAQRKLPLQAASQAQFKLLLQRVRKHFTLTPRFPAQRKRRCG